MARYSDDNFFDDTDGGVFLDRDEEDFVISDDEHPDEEERDD